MRTKHRFELETFIIEKENGIVTITEEASGVYIRFKDGDSGQLYNVECVLPFIGYLNSEERCREVFRILRKLYEFGSCRFPMLFLRDSTEVPPDKYFIQYGI